MVMEYCGGYPQNKINPEELKRKLDARKLAFQERKAEIKSLEEELKNHIADLLITGKPFPKEMTIGNYIVVGHKKEYDGEKWKEKFVIAGYEKSRAGASQLVCENFSIDSEHYPHGHFVKLTPEHVSNIKITRS